MHTRKIQQEYNPDITAGPAKKRVCAYARVSGERDEAFHSLSAQVSYYQKLISEHSDWEFVEVFCDRGITGTKENRAGFQAMLSACREGRVDMVLAKSITRFARNTVILLETVRELKKLEVDVYFEEERIHTLSSQGELMLAVLAARAQEESRSASENQLWRIRKSFEKGIPVTGNCLGYRMVGHQFFIDEEEEKTVKRIFSMYLQGMGITAIAKKLTDDGEKNRFGKVKWSPTDIGQILRNEKYCGDLKLQKVYVTDYVTKKTVRNKGEKRFFYVIDAHDPIITKKDFQEVQKEIERRAAKYKGAEKKTITVFTGLITCGKCGSRFTRGKNGAGTKYSKVTWGCKRAITYGKRYCDMGQRIPEDTLIQKTSEILGANELNEDLVHNTISEIIVTGKNTLLYKFNDGTEKTVEWHYHSRRESWTPEMKEAASKREILRRKALQQEKEK